ncbi:hypothetical protein KPH14_009220 [Odynerus spinipes]|uniref:Odorant receptor n=1 Tax=Odynerus spinipes TaxID=1348599 RepID=A0AAD9RNU3_9HYME|nr:hypothetical protein KPH14_009220 [Odynerus spinipes]
MAGCINMIKHTLTISNPNYKEDVYYTTEFNRLLLEPIGAWPNPTGAPWTKILISRLLNLINFSLVFFLFLCTFLYIILDAENIHLKFIKVGPMSFTVMTMSKFCLLVIHEKDIRRCLDHIEHDWKNVKREEDRQIMLDCATLGRRIILISTIFALSAVFFYRLIIPLISPKVVMGNYTFRPLGYPSAKVIIDMRKSPGNEFMIGLACFCGCIMSAITVGCCSLTTVCGLHACGQLRILMSYMNSLVHKKEDTNDNVNDRMSNVVKQHVRILSFVRFIEDTLRGISLVEVIGCTMNMCMLGYCLITGWKRDSLIRSLSYFPLIMSFGFNIFIFCYIGEVLAEECRKVAENIYMIDWYKLQGKSGLGLILIIAMSTSSNRLTAGKFMDLSISSFGDVMKASIAYLNMFRTIASS